MSIHSQSLEAEFVDVRSIIKCAQMISIHLIQTCVRQNVLFLKVWHSCSSCKTPRQVSPKTVSGDTAALCCDKPVSYSGSVLPDFVLELCWDIAGLSQAALVSSTCTGGAKEMSRVWWSWAELNVCTRQVWGIRHLTSQMDMGTEGASIPEYETFCSETAQEQVLALQKYQAGWGPR